MERLSFKIWIFFGVILVTIILLCGCIDGGDREKKLENEEVSTSSSSEEEKPSVEQESTNKNISVVKPLEENISPVNDKNASNNIEQKESPELEQIGRNELLSLDINTGTLNGIKIGYTIDEVKKMLGEPTSEEINYPKKIALDYSTEFGLYFIFDGEDKGLIFLNAQLRPLEEGDTTFKGEITPEYINSNLSAIEIRGKFGKPSYITGDDFICEITYYKDDFNLTFGFDYDEDTDTILPLRDIYITKHEEKEPNKYARSFPELE